MSIDLASTSQQKSFSGVSYLYNEGVSILELDYLKQNINLKRLSAISSDTQMWNQTQTCVSLDSKLLHGVATVRYYAL